MRSWRTTAAGGWTCGGGVRGAAAGTSRRLAGWGAPQWLKPHCMAATTALAHRMGAGCAMGQATRRAADWVPGAANLAHRSAAIVRARMGHYGGSPGCQGAADHEVSQLPQVAPLRRQRWVSA